MVDFLSDGYVFSKSISHIAYQLLSSRWIHSTNNEYKCQNCHVCVVDNNGKLVKALGTYVYAYKDGSTTEKEWRLIKMNA